MRSCKVFLVVWLISTLFQVGSSHAALRKASLVELIELLSSKGIEILYSSELVSDDLVVEIEEVSLDSLRDALVGVGLQLKQAGKVWVISQLGQKGQAVSGYLMTPDGEAIANGTIELQSSGRRWHSGGNGFFTIPSVPDGDNLVISARGFQTQFHQVAHDSDAPGLGTVTLIPDDWIENVIVTGSRYHFPNHSRVSSHFSMSADEMELIPAQAGDYMRVVTRLPGTSSVGIASKPRIRGGLQDELLILLDGVELLEPFHLADFHSGFSSIDGRTVGSMDIYTGGFPARYGNRMSGVMDVRTDRTLPDYPTEIGLSTFSAFVKTQGVGGDDQSVEWLFSARKGNLEELTEFMEPLASNPEYTDVFARLGITLSDRADVSLGSIYAKDDIEFFDDEELAGSKIDSSYLWARLDFEHSDDLRSVTLLSYAYTDREKGEVIDEEESEFGFLDYSQQVRQLVLRNDYSLLSGEHLYEFGWQLSYGRSQYDYVAHFDRGVLSELLGRDPVVDESIHTEPEGWAGGMYLAAEFQATTRFAVQPSLRWDVQDYYFTGRKHYLSPRLGFLYDIDKDLGLRLSVGRFYQPEGVHELQVLNGETFFFDPQRSDQVIVGLDWQRGEMTFKSEVYYKRYRDLKRRQENLFNPFVLLPEIESDRIEINSQKARASGFDLDVKYKFSPELIGQFRYSHLNADDRINNVWVPRRWSQRNTTNALLIWQQDSFNLSGALVWHSGWRTSRLPESVPADAQIPLEKVLNNTELRDYFSLDISASKSWQLGPTKITLYADVTNILKRGNKAGVDFEVEEEDDRVFFIPNNEALLSRVTSVGITLSF